MLFDTFANRCTECRPANTTLVRPSNAGHLAEVLEPVRLRELRRVGLEEPVGLVKQDQQPAAAVAFEPGAYPGPHDLLVGLAAPFGLAQRDDGAVQVAQQQVPHRVSRLPARADVGGGQLDVDGDPLRLPLERDLRVAQQGRLAQAAATEDDLGAVGVKNGLALLVAAVEHLRRDQ